MSPLFFNGPFAANRQMVQDSHQITLWEPFFPTPSHCLLGSVANFYHVTVCCQRPIHLARRKNVFLVFVRESFTQAQ